MMNPLKHEPMYPIPGPGMAEKLRRAKEYLATRKKGMEE